MKSFPRDILNLIQKQLEVEKTQVTARLHELVLQDPFSDPDRVIDNAASDREASEESTHDRFSALSEELQKQLTDITDALIRIAKGTYGFCASCGKMIDTDRLAILPTAKLCLACEGKKKPRA